MSKVPPDIQRLLQATITEMADDDIPIIPELQTLLQKELSAILPDVLQKMAALTKDATAAAITTAALEAFKQEIQDEINRTAQATPLAAFAEFGGRLHQQNAGRDVQRRNRIASAQQLAGLSESDQGSGAPTTPDQSPAMGGGIPGAETAQPAGGTAPSAGSGAQVGEPTNGQSGSAPSDADQQPDSVPNADQEAQAEQARNEAAVNPDTKTAPQSEGDNATTEQVSDKTESESTTSTEAAPPDQTPPIQPSPTPNATTAQATTEQAAPKDSSLSKRALMAAAGKAKDKIQGKFASGNFKDYQFILGVAIIKDVLDYLELAYGDPGITGTIINIFASIILAVAMYGQGETFRKRLIKKWVTRIVVPIVMEYIPIVNEWIPTYTIDIIVIYLDTKASQNKLLKSMDELDNLQKKIKGMGSKNNARQMSGIRKQINDHSQAAEQ